MRKLLTTTTAGDRSHGLMLGRTLDPMDARDGGLSRVAAERVELVNVAPVAGVYVAPSTAAFSGAIPDDDAPAVVEPVSLVPFIAAAALLLAALLVE